MDAEVQEWISKLDKAKNSADLSRDEDLSIAIMNLISLEEHFYFSAMKTRDQKYVDLLASVRSMRVDLMKKIVKDPKGEEWCISKHLLAASMRLVEVGTKELSKENKSEAACFFKQAFDLYSLFFALNLNLVPAKKLEAPQRTAGMMEKFSNAVKGLVDCCREW